MAQLVVLLGEGVGQGHHPVNNNQRDLESNAESQHLLTNGISKSGRAIRLFAHDLSHRSVGDDVPRTLDRLKVQVSDNRRVNF